MIRFYLPDIASSGLLPEEESRHCLRVLRKKTGDEIDAVDGKGFSYRLRIVNDDPRHGEAEIMEKMQEPNHWGGAIELAVAPTKNADRMEWLVEKATELGIDAFIPLLCEHSERKKINLLRLEKIAVSAMKQSLKAMLPEMRDMTPIRQFVAEPFDGRKYICYCDDTTERTQILHDCRDGYDGPVRILIGPEGDFSAEEVSLALDNGYKPVTLGNSRLRTETAALIAVADVHACRRMK